MIFSSFDIFFSRKEAKKLASLLDLCPGLKIAEIGAGKGLMSMFLAKIVGPGGLVLATEFEENKVNKILKKAQKKNLSNLQTALAKSDNPNLPNIQFDLILMSKVYHHFTKAAEQNPFFYRHLKPEGKLAIIDFEPKWYLKLFTPKNVPESYGGHGIFKDVLVTEVEQAGFELQRLVEDFSSGGMYCAVFVKR